MLSHDELRYQLYTILASPAFQQLAPLVILILIPTLVLFINSRRHSIAAAVFMVFDSLSLILPWNWSDTSAASVSSERRKLRRKQQVRSRDDQLARTSSQGTQCTSHTTERPRTSSQTLLTTAQTKMATTLGLSIFRGHIVS